MAKKTNRKVDPRVAQTWEDLDTYRDFCRYNGYRFNEQDLYNMKSYPFQQYSKFVNGKNYKDQWGVDIKRFGLR
jgi:hypothetical protein